ncbi:MAG: ribonuclease P protein subunit [Candidatus Thermoplasmatota archaeon]
MNKKKLAKHELVGRTVKIKKCTDSTLKGTSGRIIDETKNTFLIKKGKKHIRIAKMTAEFEFKINEKKISINGSKITYRPEDRTKKVR